MSKKKEKANIECKELAVVSEVVGANRITKVRVVKWVIDGVETKPKLEKRNFIATKDGSYRTGKMTGFTRDDIQNVIDHWSDIEVWF